MDNKTDDTFYSNTVQELMKKTEQIGRLGGWQTNPETRELYWTDQLYRMMAIPPGTPITADSADREMLGQGGAEMLHKLRQAWSGHLAEFSAECMVRNRSGREFWVEFRCIGRIQTEKGPYLYGTMQDIDERKKLEQEVHRWSQVFEQADFSLALINPVEARFMEVNPAYAQQRGYTPEELAGAPLDTVYAPESRPQLEKLCRQHSQGDHTVFEAMHLRKDGSSFPVRVEISPVRNQTGQVIAWVSSTSDITAEKAHAELTIRTNRLHMALLQFYAAEFTSTGDLLDHALEAAQQLSGSEIGSIYSYDEGSRILTLCTSSRGALVYNPPFICDLDSSGLWGEAIRQRRPVLINDYAADSPFKKGCPEGDQQLTRHLNLPIIRNGQVVAVVGVGNKPDAYDDEDIRQLQVLMEGCWTRLERFRSLEENIIARQLAQEAARVKTELLANMSHELRTPLNGIFGGSQLLGFTDLTPEQHEYLEMIDISAANELALVNNLLELVKLESEGVNAAQERFSLRSILSEAVRVYQWAARDKGLELTLEVGSGTPDEVVGDPIRLRQIVHNLLGNAVKFTDTGRITVRLTVFSDDDGHQLVRVQVSDTGIGIAPEDFERIFDLLTQCDQSNTREYGGLGLGLAISRRLAVALGGTIRVDSTPGVGSTFLLELPVLPAEAAAASLQRHQLNVLLVEDDKLSALSGSSLLRKMGHTVMVAANGEAALQQVQTGAFDLVLLDIHLPGQSGFDVLHRLRELEKQLGRPRLPVVAQTAYVRRNYYESFILAGFDGFLAKPLMRDELETVMERCPYVRPAAGS